MADYSGANGPSTMKPILKETYPKGKFRKIKKLIGK